MSKAFETYTSFVALSLFGGIVFPVTCAAGGALWIYARWMWAKGYSTGEPSKRYDHWVSRGIWTGLLIELGATIGTAINFFL